MGGEKTYMNEIKVHSRGGNHWSVNVISVDRIEDSHLKYIVRCCAGSCWRTALPLFSGGLVAIIFWRLGGYSWRRNEPWFQRLKAKPLVFAFLSWDESLHTFSSSPYLLRRQNLLQSHASMLPPEFPYKKKCYLQSMFLHKCRLPQKNHLSDFMFKFANLVVITWKWAIVVYIRILPVVITLLLQLHGTDIYIPA